MKPLALLLTASAVIGGFALVDETDENHFTRITPEWKDPVYRQYDFWIGLYHANWRSKKPDEFLHQDQGLQATHWLYPTLNGKALLEFGMSDYPIDTAGARVQGFSVRYYDEEKARWVMAQEWPSANATNGIADQLQGFYRFGRIQVFSTFTSPQTGEERTRRYSFSDIRPEGFHWHGTTTADSGKTWTAGTLVEFSKIEATAKWPEVGQSMPNYDGAGQCTEDRYRAFDDLAGAWTGTITHGGSSARARLTGFKMLGGCALISYLEFDDEDEPYTLLEVRSMGRAKTDWWVYRLDSRKGTAHTYQIGEFDGDRITLLDNNQYVIEDEFKNHSIRNIPRDDTKALKKTVWQNIGPNRLEFEWWKRSSTNADWNRDASFVFQR